MHHIAIFASGSGTNARKIIEYFATSSQVKIALIVCNKSEAGVLSIADEFDIPKAVINKLQLQNESFMCHLLDEHQINFIVLAGFLLLIPDFLIHKFPKRIVNIHPALLPKYGGRGMYGKFVHQAVHQNKECQTGITIHYASEHYDEGDIIFQQSIELTQLDTPETIAQKVQKLEHQYFPKVIDEMLKKV